MSQRVSTGDAEDQRATVETAISSKKAVQVLGVSKIYAGSSEAVTALDDVTLEIETNEFFTLLGPSGCGKTTLLRLIAGFEEPNAGEILLDGEPIAGRPPYHRLVNTVFQSYALFPHMSVAENIAFGLRMRKIDRAMIAERISEMLALVKLEGLGGRRPAQLSGGQQQRVALARALANHPKVLLLDEPLSALDLKLRKEMRLELKRLQRETGITFVFVTHDQEEALEMSDRVAVMSAGTIQQVDAPSAVYERPVNRFVADFIGETNFLEAAVTGVDGEELICELAPGVPIKVIGQQVKDRHITLAVRPERVILVPDRDEAGPLSGRVVERVYQGGNTAYHVRLDAGQRLVGRAAESEHGAGSFSIGDRVAARIAPGSVRVVQE